MGYKDGVNTYFTVDGKVTRNWDEGDDYMYGSCGIKIDHITNKEWHILEAGIRRLLQDFYEHPLCKNARPEDVQIGENNGRLEIHFKGLKQKEN